MLAGHPSSSQGRWQRGCKNKTCTGSKLQDFIKWRTFAVCSHNHLSSHRPQQGLRLRKQLQTPSPPPSCSTGTLPVALAPTCVTYGEHGLVSPSPWRSRWWWSSPSPHGHSASRDVCPPQGTASSRVSHCRSNRREREQ